MEVREQMLLRQCGQVVCICDVRNSGFRPQGDVMSVTFHLLDMWVIQITSFDVKFMTDGSDLRVPLLNTSLSLNFCFISGFVNFSLRIAVVLESTHIALGRYVHLSVQWPWTQMKLTENSFLRTWMQTCSLF